MCHTIDVSFDVYLTQSNEKKYKIGMGNEFSKYFVVMSYYVAPFITPFIYFAVK